MLLRDTGHSLYGVRRIEVSTKSQENLVADQFGPRAAAYVASAVHAQGEDLRQLAGIVRGHKDARVLDLGCGGGHVAFNVAPEVAEVTAYDLSDEMLRAVAQEAARRGLGNVVTKRGAVEALPFADASFDFVITRFSAHHWHDLAAGLREARRVVKPKGQAVFVDCVSPGPPLLDTYLQGIELIRDPSHVRDYSSEEWTAALKHAGFAPGALTRRRLKLEFTPWVERMQVTPVRVEAIRALQKVMAPEVVRHFEIQEDGAFTIDTMTLEASPA